MGVKRINIDPTRSSKNIGLVTTLAFCSAALAVSATAQAQSQRNSTPVGHNGFSCTYAQLAYDRWGLECGEHCDLDLDVVSIEGSHGLNRHPHWLGGTIRPSLAVRFNPDSLDSSISDTTWTPMMIRVRRRSLRAFCNGAASRSDRR
ncbi:hypothetical protein B5T_02521 [Alloalcanivorax dieselolei B5]|uniref:Uncharacterized protein n=1 Tax=Alcanivorax dieselolei (strain DSM 16502 / CGMCC 1.3690 / MCCC 1A00001 / B-5) TaxID=930169 RepID=K0CB94_ALCDB|nr:hypothetical protein B5T_02521 [Alloalcanivorax dieselolei B5]